MSELVIGADMIRVSVCIKFESYGKADRKPNALYYEIYLVHAEDGPAAEAKALRLASRTCEAQNADPGYACTFENPAVVSRTYLDEDAGADGSVVWFQYDFASNFTPD